MSPKKRLLLFFTMVGLLALGFSAPGEAQGRRGGRSVVIVGGGFYPRGYFFADPFWYGYPWFPYQYPIGPWGYGYRYYAFDRESSVRLEVSPKEAEVFVDGFYAGIVDDFDGVFQRLHLPRGQHEITLYREGYRTVHQSVYLPPDSTFKIRYKMVKLAPGDVAEARPTPPSPPPAAQEPGPPEPPPGRRGPGPAGRRFPPPPPRTPGALPGEASASGALSIRVQPGGATVLIDGERWEGPEGPERLIVEVADGTHRVQIQKEGYESFSTDVTVRRGETTPLNVSLRTR